LHARVQRQKRDIHLASQIFAISHIFGQYLVDDYGVSPGRLRFLPNPIDLDELQPAPNDLAPGPPWRFAFVGRISVRKGLELVIELSHRLADLEGTISLELAGPDTLWSDYRPLLTKLNPSIATYHGQLNRDELIALLRRCDFVIQPAQYEPF